MALLIGEYTGPRRRVGLAPLDSLTTSRSRQGKGSLPVSHFNILRPQHYTFRGYRGLGLVQEGGEPVFIEQDFLVSAFPEGPHFLFFMTGCKSLLLDGVGQ